MLHVWMEKRYGTKPDSFLGAKLRGDTLKIKDDTDVGPMVAFVRDVLDGHNTRPMEKRERGRRREAEQIMAGWRLYGSLRRVLDQRATPETQNSLSSHSTPS